ncbi:MAG: outer membrane beta-barrel protein [Acidobacteria bacterium]|nr:outer membrane beta-barrel protein [Acidobacteriota bacterium]
MNNSTKHLRNRWIPSITKTVILLFLIQVAFAKFAAAQSLPSTSDAAQSMDSMRQRISTLEAEVEALKSAVKQLQASQPSVQPNSAPMPSTLPLPSQPRLILASAPALTIEAPMTAANTAPISTASVEPQTQSPPPTPTTVPSASALQPDDDSKLLSFLRDTTIDVALDGYYDYNFNAPVGRVNLLRAYDVLSNEFNLNQADVIFDHPADPTAGRRWGGRLDLQFGQATDTLQGNPNNEPRPDIYRNIFQAYATYIAPIGKGLEIDFGKWGSSLGIEGNYTKDQMNYSRSYFFDFLPFYHMGIRASLPVTDKFTVNYWVVNGTNQVEATNGFKDELFGFVYKPTKSITWTSNYYLGQEHPDRAVSAIPTNPIPVQPDLNFIAIRPAPNGRTHIFDNYVTWQPTPKLTIALEGDYFIQRLWQNQAPGESAAPSHVTGGAAYVQYHFTPRMTLATRAEYLSDRGGLFSGITQALKENTVTFDYKLADGFLMRYEWRRDYSNQPSFLSDTQGLLEKQQTTATVGLLWWWGRKEGTW